MGATNMIHKLRQLLAIATVGTLLAGATGVPAGAIDLFRDCTGANRNTAVCQASGTDDATNTAQDVVNILLLLIGAVSVIMIVIGGFKYVTSNGDQNNITSAKNTILYAVIGLIVAIMASAIVNFVVTQFI